MILKKLEVKLILRVVSSDKKGTERAVLTQKEWQEELPFGGSNS